VKNVVFKNSEEALETLRLATEAANLGVWDFNVDSGELHWSELSKSMFGITKVGTLCLDDFFDRLHPEEIERVQAAMKHALDPGGTGEYDIDYRVCRPSGEQRHVHAKGKAFFEGEGDNRRATRFIGTLLDRTEQRLAQAALVQAEQLAATGRLAASIAHEINNPLEAATNLLYLLRTEVSDAAGQEYLRQAEFEVARAAQVAASTLRFYRDPTGITQVEISGLVRSVISLFQGKISLRGICLHEDCAPGTLVRTSQGELRQVLVNLIGNAIDAMPQGGHLSLRCRSLRHISPDGRLSVAISIADTGVGMTPEVLGRAFDPFFTTKGSLGTGLGLWLTREIAKKYGFHLRVRSKPGHGSVFRLFLPDGGAPDLP
jgi:signal transduction histidine kinase